MTDVQVPEVASYNDEDIRADAAQPQFADGAIVQIVLRRGERRVQNPKIKVDDEGNNYEAGGHLYVRYQVHVCNPAKPGKVIGRAPFLNITWWMPLRNPDIEGHQIESWVRDNFAKVYEALEPDEFPYLVQGDGNWVVRDQSFACHKEARQAQSVAKLTDAVDIWGGEWRKFEGATCYGTISRDERYTNVENLRAELKPHEELTPMSELLVDE